MKRVSNFYLRLKEYRQSHNLTLAELEKLTGIPAQTLNRYELNQRTPKVDMANLIAEALHVHTLWLQGYDVPMYADTEGDVTSIPAITYPIIGEVAAGFGSEAIEEETGDYEQIPVEWLRGRKQDEFFVLRVKGDSMYPNYMDGDRVLVLRTPTVESGTIAVVLYDGQSATLKKVNYVYGEDWMELEPLNREYAPKRIEAADLEQCRVLGEVKRLIRVISE